MTYKNKVDFKGVYRGRYRGMYGTEEFIILCYERMWIDLQKLYKGGRQSFIDQIKNHMNLTENDTTFFGESYLNNGDGRIDFIALNPKDLPIDLLKDYLMSAFRLNNRWYGTYCNCSVYYKSIYLSKIKEIAEQY